MAENYRFTFLGLWLTVSTTYQGEAANDRRRHYGVTPISTQTQDYLDFYSDRYPGLQLVRPITVTDDRDGNYFVVDESYFLPAMALLKDEVRTDFYFGAENFASNLTEASTAPRRASSWRGSRPSPSRWRTRACASSRRGPGSPRSWPS
ncbi:MAG: hypothetical protein HC933_09300 [Pleurocapsa sp. SU_196_0]|nr:hypothetical protein [Pleurocapsa sp. SU_196_0]